MTPRTRRGAQDEDTVQAASEFEDGPVTLYDTDGRSLEVYTQRELTRFRAWGYTTEDPAAHVDQPQEPATP